MCSQGSRVHVYIWSKTLSASMNQTHSSSLESPKSGPATRGPFRQRVCTSLGYMPSSVTASSLGSEALHSCFRLRDSWLTWVDLGNPPNLCQPGVGLLVEYHLIFSIGTLDEGDPKNILGYQLLARSHQNSFPVKKEKTWGSWRDGWERRALAVKSSGSEFRSQRPCNKPAGHPAKALQIS